MKVDRHKFMLIAMSMSLGNTMSACGGGGTGGTAEPEATYGGSNVAVEARAAPADECVDWDPSGECVAWEPAAEAGYRSDSPGCTDWDPSGECVAWGPADECIGWDPSGECIDWESATAPADECIGWDPSGECIDWEPAYEG